MRIDLERSRQYLKQFQFQQLFVEELGWDNHTAQPLSLLIENKTYALKAVAEKRGQVVYACLAEDGTIPNSATRTKIHKEVTQYTLENVIVYTDQAQTEQVWQWVRSDPGKPKSNRFHQFHKSQFGDALLQKLEALAVSFEEEEQLTLVDVTSRTRRAFDVDRVTKKFYERFKKEHGLFLKFLTGICSQFDQEWYCSLMLNRLMFVYFMQKKGFLDGNTNYLRDRLQVCQFLRGQDNFHSFYRYFLLKLFHDGLGKPKRTPELEQLIGKVPYLNGGLFEAHQLEQTYPEIQIPDQAFEKIFDFFDEYQWHLDDRPLRDDREINPDVLGYIFEKYINQKQMGAYYTKEDITEYISKNTIIPFLFDAAEKACSIAFRPDGAMWQLLRENPNRYIYTAVQKGVDLPLPEEVSVGVEDVSQRQGWNRPADRSYALLTETWREHIARRQRCLELRQKLAAGEVHSINDLITHNLDIRQFAQDVIENCEGPELLRAFYKAICQVSILDPTCGSGAFLFAALNILEPLYDACLERMQVFLDDLTRAGQKHHPEKFSDFRQVLDRVAQHPNCRYFILKSIILNNLYGVDIMEEATEICKLRLFLKLVSQVERDTYAENYGLEPLPDIDFNIRAGNTLVGFANYEEVRKAVEGDEQKKLDLFNDMQRIDESAEEADRAFQKFREMQTEHGMDAEQFRNAKVQLRQRLRDLNQELNRYLAEAYEIGLSKRAKEFEKWLTSHQPFHWFVEFYGIMNHGGFDAIIGNPPYVESSKIKQQYTTLAYQTSSCGNLYALALERSYQLISKEGKSGFIVPLSLVCTKRMNELRELLRSQTAWISCYDMRPSSLFEGVAQRLCVILAQNQRADLSSFTGGYRRWSSSERSSLLPSAVYTERKFSHNVISKLSLSLEGSLLSKISGESLELLWDDSSKPIYIHRIVRYFIKALSFIPLFIDANGQQGKSDDYKAFGFLTAEKDSITALLNSSLFYWFWRTHSDGFHCGYGDVFLMPYQRNISASVKDSLRQLNQNLMKGLHQSSIEKRIKTKTGTICYQEFAPKVVKPIIDEIDCILAKHYGFTDEELDFIINYDIKYRMGRDTEDEG